MNKCLQCNSSTNNKFYCSRTCGAIHKRKKREKPLSTCPCGIKYKPKMKKNGEYTKYHSVKCYSQTITKDKNPRSNGKWVICAFDGKPVYRQMAFIKDGKKYFCNGNCQKAFTKGENHHLYGKKITGERYEKLIKQLQPLLFKEGQTPNWKGGISPVNERIRRRRSYKQWRTSVFEKDNYTCQVTGQRGGELVAHHLCSFSEHKELQLVIENGMTMTKVAHKAFHDLYGYGNNTVEQMIEFINANTRLSKVQIPQDAQGV